MSYLGAPNDSHMSINDFVRSLTVITDHEELAIVGELVSAYELKASQDLVGYLHAKEMAKAYLRQCAAWGDVPVYEHATPMWTVWQEVLLDGIFVQTVTHQGSSAIN